MSVRTILGLSAPTRRVLAALYTAGTDQACIDGRMYRDGDLGMLRTLETALRSSSEERRAVLRDIAKLQLTICEDGEVMVTLDGEPGQVEPQPLTAHLDPGDSALLTAQHPDWSPLQVALACEMRQITAANRDAENRLIEHAVKRLGELERSPQPCA